MLPPELERETDTHVNGNGTEVAPKPSDLSPCTCSLDVRLPELVWPYILESHSPVHAHWSVRSQNMALPS